MIPKPIYEFLPYLYVLAGIAAMSLMDLFMAFASGLLMSVTGVLVLWLRRNYRQSPQFIEDNLQTQ